MLLYDFIERSNRLSEPEALAALFARTTAEHGYDRFAYIPADITRPIDAETLSRSVIDCPAEWRDHYLTNQLFRFDPVVAIAPSSSGPFRWDALRDLTPAQRELFHDANDAGLHQGVCIPLYGPFGSICVVSLASSSPKTDPAAAILHLQALSFQFHVAYRSLIGPPDPAGRSIRLTPRERDCLTWAARGKSSWDIGIILNISERTAKFHALSAMRKLECHNRITAIVKAIRLGLIQP